MPDQASGVAVVAVTPPLMNELLARILVEMDLEVVRHPECLDEDRPDCHASLAVVSDGVPPELKSEILIRVVGHGGTVTGCGYFPGDEDRVFDSYTLEDLLAVVRSHLARRRGAEGGPA